MGGSDPWGCLITSTSLSHQFTEHRCAAQRRRPGEITCAISMGRCGYGPLRERVSVGVGARVCGRDLFG